MRRAVAWWWIVAMVASLTATTAIAAEQEAQMAERSDAAAAIMEADRDFCSALKARDLATFRGFVAEDARFYGGAVSVGRDRVAEAWGGFFAEDRKSVLLWTPKGALVAASGDLGYTHGTYELQSTAEDGSAKIGHGQYVSIWRRDTDGRWRVIVDIGTPPGASPLVENQ